MAALYKLDDGQCYPTNCFPAKSLLQPRYEEGAGHWQVARHNVEKTKVEWLFGRKVAQQSWQECLRKAQCPRPEKVLNGAQLIKLHHVQTPSDLCSVNISHQNFALARESDFMQFDSVAYINATENLLTLQTFRSFPGLRELELSLNGLRNLKVRTGDFPHLEILDLSYNNLSPEDVQSLGILPRLKALHLTANGLSSLPLNLAAPESWNCPKFPALEVLLLDDNHLSDSSVFLSLANLRRLKQLNLDKNGIKEVPYLHYLGHDRFSIHPLSAKSGIRAGLRCRKNSPPKPPPDRSPRLNQQYSYIITQNTQDPEKTEVVFQARTPEETARERPPSPLEDSKSPWPNISTEFLLPLPELRFLSLANNQIENEEDLLAVALFPSLTELTFYGNPFTTSRSGDPPLLTSFLQNKLGIKLVRKKVSKLEKPRVFIPIKASREIKSRLPKIRKQPMTVERSLETTFWQLWMGADLDPDKRLGSLAVPDSRSFSMAYDPDQPILSPLRPEERSACISLTTLYNEAFTPGSSLEGTSYGSDTPRESSVDHILAGKVSASQSRLGPSPSEVLPPSQLASQGPPGLPAPREAPSSGHLPSEPPLLAEGRSESVPYLRTSSGEHLPEVHLEPVAPPNSPSEEQDGSESVQMVGPEEEEEEEGEEEEGRTFFSTASGEELTQSLLEQKGSEPLVSSEPGLGEEDLSVPLSPVRSLSAEKDLPSRGSSAEDQDREESVPISYPSEEDLEEGVPLIGSGELLPEVALPTVSSEEEEEEEEPSQLPTFVLEDMTLLGSSEEEEYPGSPSSPLGEKENLTLVDLSTQTSSRFLVPPSRSVSGDLYKLFAQVRDYALPPEPEEDASMVEEMLTSSGQGVTEPIFITQVEESLDSRRSRLNLGKVTLNVPEKLRGYEELLGGDPGSDFVEPKGIQQNVQALEKALRYPLVYRDPKARLDSYQKPYVSAKKKVLRVPAPKPRKTRMERLEEILLDLRKPRNIVHIPLVCILRRRKENWREYREALELLKEFQRNYKATVAVCNKANESRAIGNAQVPKTDLNPIPKFRSLPEIKARRKAEESSAQALQEKNDSLPTSQ
ncbi:X-ray radiation resistance-associated protein 1 [Ahaetulla prasina]|uniref:X-ray radiation resistance-associated protein 1 n=1 Tax=Ahaetulla prasina TaxID=499056 RepID=UPI0026493E07|nr:X-ray radiation resistance-associated protein 1 [Ahaetulla prasina]XP_058042040.1 X-ray radiation resistance-associated protein 1 [Ahaetulla prasina]